MKEFIYYFMFPEGKRIIRAKNDYEATKKILERYDFENDFYVIRVTRRADCVFITIGELPINPKHYDGI